MNLKICYLKIDVSCEASIKFHHTSQNATPTTEFARCHRLTQPWQCDSQKTRNTTRAAPATQNIAAPATKNATHLLETTRKYCACHAKRSYAARETSKSYHFCRTRHRHGHTGLTRPPANGCGLRNVWRTQHLKWEPLLRIREKTIAKCIT